MQCKILTKVTFSQITLSVVRLLYIRPTVLEGHSNITISLFIQVVNIKFLKRQLVKIRINYSQHIHFFSGKKNASVHFHLTWMCFYFVPQTCSERLKSWKWLSSHIVNKRLTEEPVVTAFVYFFFCQWLTQWHQGEYYHVISAIWWALCNWELQMVPSTDVSTATNDVLATWQSVPLSN
jgi:hypothetical protein